MHACIHQFLQVFLYTTYETPKPMALPCRKETPKQLAFSCVEETRATLAFPCEATTLASSAFSFWVETPRTMALLKGPDRKILSFRVYFVTKFAERVKIVILASTRRKMSSSGPGSTQKKSSAPG